MHCAFPGSAPLRWPPQRSSPDLRVIELTAARVSVSPENLSDRGSQTGPAASGAPAKIAGILVEEHWKDRFCHVVANRESHCTPSAKSDRKPGRPHRTTDSTCIAGPRRQTRPQAQPCCDRKCPPPRSGNFSLGAMGLYSCNAGEVRKFGMIHKTRPERSFDPLGRGFADRGNTKEGRWQ